MATKTEKLNEENLAEENPRKTLDPTVPHAAIAVVDSSNETATHAASTQYSSLQEPASKATSSPGSSPNGGSESKEIVSTVASEAGNDAPLTDVKKKMRRAERFGISVQPSEQEKRNSRAERFGITRPSSTADDDEAKKKARLAKFAPASKVDPLEEEKRKARAIRFSNPPSSSLSRANGTGGVKPKEAIAGEAARQT